MQASSSKSCNACRCYFLRAAEPRLKLLYDLPLLLLSAVAQPLAALLPYGCGTPLAGAALLILRKSLASGMEMPARGVAAFRVAARLASAPTIRCCAAVGGFAALRMRYTPCGCRSAHLVGVQPNSRLPPVPTMRRAQQCRIRQAVCRRANVTRASR